MSKDTQLHVYLLAIDSAPQPYIAKVLELTRQAVNYHIKRLIKSGYIRPIRGSHPITYVKTSKSHPAGHHRVWSEDAPFLRSHHTSRKFNMVSPPLRPWGLIWDREWVASNVHHHVARKIIISTSEGDISVKTIRLSIGKQRSSLTVWADEDYLLTTVQLHSHEDHATEISILVANELALRTGARFALPEIMQDTHYALPVPGTWLDKSPGVPELETSDKKVALTWMTLPDIIKGLKSDLKEVRDAVQQIVGLEQETGKGILAIKDGLENLDTRIKVLEGTFPKIDNSEGMFG